MLSKSQEQLIRQLHTKKGREKHALCLVEGVKNVEAAKNFIEFTFTQEDTEDFNTLVTTETPQQIAAVARIPEEGDGTIDTMQTILLLDGVQDPGNVGAILRLCIAFNAGLYLVDSADITSPKVIRSSAGAVFQTPWAKLSRATAETYLENASTAKTHTIFRLEKKSSSHPVTELGTPPLAIIIAGSEGNGIQLPIKGVSIAIPHSEQLESLNVTHAVAIALYERYASLL